MKKVLKIIKYILITILLILVLACFFSFLTGYGSYKSVIDEMSIGDRIDKIRSKEGYVLIQDMPKHYKDAVVAIEDRRFYKHGAIDIISIGRAIKNNISAMDFVEGGSTISQQVAKNVLFSQEEKLSRKIAEVFGASDLEKLYSKDEILELYVNTAFFGTGGTRNPAVQVSISSIKSQKI